MNWGFKNFEELLDKPGSKYENNLTSGFSNPTKIGIRIALNNIEIVLNVKNAVECEGARAAHHTNNPVALFQ